MALLLGVGSCAGPELDDALLASAGEATPSGCPAPPPGMTAAADAAIDEVNRIRRRAGLGCIEQVPAIARAAERHCQYYVANSGPCIVRPHREASDCPSFVGETFGDRLRIAGYRGHPSFEVMAYVGDGRTSVRMWLDSVWHRVPILSPEVEHAGYGAAGRCDTLDFGTPGDRSLTWRDVVYPHDGQTDVPRAFAGRESPEPPPPPTGWPSGYPVTLYAAGLQVTQHDIRVDGSATPLPHTFIPPEHPAAAGLLIHEFMLYTHTPLAPQTRHRVHITGTREGHPHTFEWTFTTR